MSDVFKDKPLYIIFRFREYTQDAMDFTVDRPYVAAYQGDGTYEVWDDLMEPDSVKFSEDGKSMVTECGQLHTNIEILKGEWV